MTISLQNIQPAFLKINSSDASQIWNKPVKFNKGEHLHIVAPSGKGKTSLIHFLYGLRKDYTGEIFYNNENIKSFDAEKFATWRQQHVSIVFQDLRLFTEQTVYQNIEIKRVLAAYHHDQKITEMAGRLGIESKLSKLCKTCSYGEQQRIAIIRALMQPFDFLLLDEPFSHLDENNRQKAMDLIEEEANARNATIILADLKKIEYFNEEKILQL
jgi:putative ABC transport system ATP-binding protein